MKKRLSALLILLIVLIGELAMFSEAHADRAVRFFEMLKHTDGQFYNQPFDLLPWEKQAIRDVYGTLKEDGTRQYQFVYLELPKKNGKSELVAGAMLYHTFADGEYHGEIYGCAADRKQASIVYNVAKNMVDLVPSLNKRSRKVDSQKKIVDKKSGSVYEVLSSEAFTKHGFKPSAVGFDELHAQPNRDLWDVMTFGAGATRRQPIWWIITTAGDDPDRVSIGWEIHEKAERILASRNGTGPAEDDDPTWYVMIFNYDGDDIYNEENWYRANPSLGPVKSIDAMRADAERAKQSPADERLFRWLHLNQWLTYKLTTWLPLDLFDATVGNWSRADLLGKDCYLGMDLSATTDLTAICALFPPQKEQLDWRCFWHCWLPEDILAERVKQDHVPYDKWAEMGHLTVTKGNVVDYTEVEKTILEIKKFYNVIEVPSDRAFAAMLLQRLEQAQMTCVDIPQTFKVMTGPMNLVELLFKKAANQENDESPNAEDTQGQGEDDLEKEVKEQLGEQAYQMLQAGITHENNLVARWCFGNASISKNGNAEIKLVKEHKGRSVDRTKRIDLMTALVNAAARAQFYKGNVDLSAMILSDDWGM
jgi:phage terminase large subunit-like protein